MCVKLVKNIPPNQSNIEYSNHLLISIFKFNAGSRILSVNIKFMQGVL